MSETRPLVERLRWLLDRLIVNGYHALPCRTCDSSGDIGVHDLAEMLREAADQIVADAERIRYLEAKQIEQTGGKSGPLDDVEIDAYLAAQSPRSDPEKLARIKAEFERLQAKAKEIGNGN